jgi:hypothetical protein
MKKQQKEKEKRDKRMSLPQINNLHSTSEYF